MQVVNILKEILIIDIESTIHGIQILDPYILMPILDFVGMRIQTAVWSNDTIAIEVVVAGRITSIVATIGKDFLTGNRTLVTQTLIYKVPDVSTLILRIFANQIPVLLETAL